MGFDPGSECLACLATLKCCDITKVNTYALIPELALGRKLRKLRGKVSRVSIPAWSVSRV